MKVKHNIHEHAFTDSTDTAYTIAVQLRIDGVEIFKRSREGKLPDYIRVAQIAALEETIRELRKDPVRKELGI